MIRPFVLYPLLVGLPALGVVGVLRVGRTLEAPPAVGGAWGVEADPVADSLCIERFSPSAVRITQSGTHLTVSWGGAEMRGTIRGSAMTAVEAGRDASDGGCAAGPLRLEAEIPAEAVPGALRGRVSIDGCGSCPRATFDALRLPSQTRRGKGH